MSQNDEPHQEKGSLRRSIALIGLAIGVANFLLYLPALDLKFVNLDDNVTIVRNTHFRGLGATQLQWMWTSFYNGHYHPLTWLSFAIDWAAWGETSDGVPNARGFHLTNNLLHAFNASLIFFVGATLVRSARRQNSVTKILAGPAIAAFLFSIHPQRVESVAWVTERRDVLSLFFLLASLLLWLKNVHADRRRWLLASIACFLCSLLSKAWGITLPVVLILLDAYPVQRLTPASHDPSDRIRQRAFLEKLPYVVLAIVFAGLAIKAQAAANATSTLSKLPLVERLAIAGYSACWYPTKAFWPINLHPYRLPPEDIRLIDPMFAVPVLVATALTVCSILYWRHSRAASTAWLAYLVLLSPVSGLTKSGYQLVADRYGYVPLIPLVVLLRRCDLKRTDRRTGRPRSPISHVADFRHRRATGLRKLVRVADSPTNSRVVRRRGAAYTHSYCRSVKSDRAVQRRRRSLERKTLFGSHRVF